MFQSGAWVGHWDQNGMGRQEMNDLVLEFDGSRIVGQGSDCVGKFTLKGEIEATADVHLVKTYVSRHSVVYQGRHDGEGMIHGVWALEGDNGTWAIRPAGGFRKSDAPILELRP